LVKRGLNGTYVAVESFHLDAYLDEQMFRFTIAAHALLGTREALNK